MPFQASLALACAGSFMFLFEARLLHRGSLCKGTVLGCVGISSKSKQTNRLALPNDPPNILLCGKGDEDPARDPIGKH